MHTLKITLKLMVTVQNNLDFSLSVLSVSTVWRLVSLEIKRWQGAQSFKKVLMITQTVTFLLQWVDTGSQIVTDCCDIWFQISNKSGQKNIRNATGLRDEPNHGHMIKLTDKIKWISRLQIVSHPNDHLLRPF